MNRRIILRILSSAALAEAALLAMSGCVGLLYGDEVLVTYGIPIGLLLLYGLALGQVKPLSRDFYAREGILSVALCWIQLSVFGALPFYLGGAVPSYGSCLFETVSGFTTTGATILVDVEALPKGLLFWRSFTHWIGGMGVLVFLTAIQPLAGERSIHLLRAEAPGPTLGKLAPRLRSTAGILYGMYVGLTALLLALLLFGGVPVFDSVTIAFATAGTGGFAVTNAGIPFYASAYVETVVAVFMLLFGVNFNCYYLLLLRRPKEAFRCEELRWYLGLYAAATAVIALNILPLCENLGEALGLAAFQNAAIMSTTGFATADFARWPELSQMVLILLMTVGSCAGSTGGGFKISRVVIVLKSIRRECSRMLHPRSVGVIKFEGKAVEQEVGHGVLVYLATYVTLAMGGVLLVSMDGYDQTTVVSAVLTTLNNVGPGLELVGPQGNFSLFSPGSRLVLTALMLIGRLEIYPMLMLCAPSVWKRK